MRLKDAIDRAKEVNRVMSHRISQAEYYRENREVILKRRKEVPGYGG
jgi:hypothetical protein